jgi:hypothetical protein
MPARSIEEIEAHLRAIGDDLVVHADGLPPYDRSERAVRLGVILHRHSLLMDAVWSLVCLDASVNEKISQLEQLLNRPRSVEMADA